MPPIPLKVILCAALAAAIFGGGWMSRSVVADRDMLEFQAGLWAKQAELQDLTRKIEAAGAKNTQASSARVDVQEQQRVTEVRYVDREVIKYRDRPGASRCVLPAEFVRLYNRAGLHADVPSAGPTRPAIDGAAAGLSAAP